MKLRKELTKLASERSEIRAIVGCFQKRNGLISSLKNDAVHGKLSKISVFNIRRGPSTIIGLRCMRAEVQTIANSQFLSSDIHQGGIADHLWSKPERVAAVFRQIICSMKLTLQIAAEMDDSVFQDEFGEWRADS